MIQSGCTKLNYLVSTNDSDAKRYNTGVGVYCTYHKVQSRTAALGLNCQFFALSAVYRLWRTPCDRVSAVRPVLILCPRTPSPDYWSDFTQVPSRKSLLRQYHHDVTRCVSHPPRLLFIPKLSPNSPQQSSNHGRLANGARLSQGALGSTGA